MDKICKYPQCYKCEYDYCIKDGQISQKEASKKRDRTAYYKEYYRKKKDGKKVQRVSKTQYIRYVTVRNTIAKLKKQIGEVNYNLIMDAIEQIEKE